jgi:Phage gp6-like head-tail connector protein
VPVTPNANALLTVEDMRGTIQEPGPLGITGTAQDDVIQELINRASDEIERYCGRYFTALDMDVYLAQTSSTNLRPPRTPIDVTKPIAITVDGQALSVWRTSADGDRRGKQVIVAGEPEFPDEATFFYRASGWLCGCSDPTPIHVVYTGGGPPGDIREAAQLVVQTFWRHRQNVTDLSTMSSGTAGGVTTFRDWYIPMAAVKVLDRHRIVPV